MTELLLVDSEPKNTSVRQEDLRATKAASSALMGIAPLLVPAVEGVSRLSPPAVSEGEERF
jgi:hypothetical protein